MPEEILIIGGGIAGINAALNIADYGCKVYLIDDTPSIGGMMARLDKTFPTNDCSICIESPLMYEVDNHPKIEILTNTEVRRVNKSNGTFTVRLLKKAKFIDEEKCTGCGACMEVCHSRKLCQMFRSLTQGAVTERCGIKVHVWEGVL
jgi:heterodisulfide reductase subunit A